MSDVVPALVGLVGVVIGAGVTQTTSWLLARRDRELAERERVRGHVEVVAQSARRIVRAATGSSAPDAGELRELAGRLGDAASALALYPFTGVREAADRIDAAVGSLLDSLGDGVEHIPRSAKVVALLDGLQDEYISTGSLG